MKFILESVIHEGADIYTLHFLTDSPLRYEAGQFIELTLPHSNPDDRGIKRWFTLSSSPSEKMVAITTRNFKSTASSFKKALFALKPGDSVLASEAMGDFVLPKDNSRPLLFVAGGIGITPMRSMVKFLADRQEMRDVTLLYAASDSQHLVLLDDFQNTNAKIVPIVSNEPGSLRLSAELILEYHKTKSLIYISGPEPMTEKLVDDLNNKGVKESQLVTDYFPGYANEYATVSA